MHYEGIVYRPPSEANSIIVQVTLGCRHNKCTFCTMYKDKQFKIRDLQKIYRDLEEERQCYSRVDRIFLADGKDRKSTRLNSSHANISYAVFCLKKKKNHNLYPYILI